MATTELAGLAVTYKDIAAAAKRLESVAYKTPVLTSSQADHQADASVFFKCENFQRVGAFKFRGAYNAISCLSEEQKQQGVVAFSSGNHAQGMALAARMLGVHATIVMPSNAPAMKLAATREYGAEIILYDREREDREVIAAQLSAERGCAVIPAYDHADVIAGQGTAAKELFDEVGPLDYLFVCTGGGGLLSGCAIAAAQLSSGCIVMASNRKRAMTPSSRCEAAISSTSRCRTRLPTAPRRSISASWCCLSCRHM